MVQKSQKYVYRNSQGRTLQPGESPTFVETWKEMEKLVVSGKLLPDL